MVWSLFGNKRNDDVSKPDDGDILPERPEPKWRMTNMMNAREEFAAARAVAELV